MRQSTPHRAASRQTHGSPPATRPAACSAAGSGGAPGFSLVELVFVLVVVGILTSMAAPILNPGRWRTDGAAQEVTLALNAAQRLAVLRQHDVHITFQVSDRRLRIHQDADNDGLIGSGEQWRVLELPETIGFDAGTAAALNGRSGPISFAPPSGDPVLTFHRNGSASSSGVVYMRPVQGNLAGSAEAVRALSIERATGEIRCFSYRTGSWEDPC